MNISNGSLVKKSKQQETENWYLVYSYIVHWFATAKKLSDVIGFGRVSIHYFISSVKDHSLEISWLNLHSQTKIKLSAVIPDYR